MRPIFKNNNQGMNKLEARYATYLQTLKIAGEIEDFRYEDIKLRLAAQKCWYTPDFFVVYDTHFEFHETKGFWHDDARVKIKVAASLYPWMTFKAIQEKRGQWVVEEIKA